MSTGSSENLTQVVAANNQFAIDLYQRQASVDGNLFMSPASVSTLLAMVYAGADGETRKQMQQVLHLQADEDEVHAGFSELMKRLNGSADVKLNVANKLWAQQDYQFLHSFLDLGKKYYDAATARLNFGESQQAVDTINGWVEEKTQGKIKDLLTIDDVDGATTLVLTNAIYFKANWIYKFNPSLTRESEFTNAAGEKSNIPMMNQTAEFNYVEHSGTSVLEMPYAGDQYSLVVLLPDSSSSLSDLESGLSAGKLDELLGAMRKRKVDVRLPKFKFELRSELNDLLKELGMTDAFSTAADFSKMTGQRDLFLAKVIHKAFIEVNEEGSEAAAASAATMKRSAAPRNPQFIANRPFMYLIRDKESGAILFMGRMTETQ